MSIIPETALTDIRPGQVLETPNGSGAKNVSNPRSILKTYCSPVRKTMIKAKKAQSLLAVDLKWVCFLELRRPKDKAQSRRQRAVLAFMTPLVKLAVRGSRMTLKKNTMKEKAPTMMLAKKGQ